MAQLTLLPPQLFSLSPSSSHAPRLKMKMFYAISRSSISFSSPSQLASEFTQPDLNRLPSSQLSLTHFKLRRYASIAVASCLPPGNSYALLPQMFPEDSSAAAPDDSSPALPRPLSSTSGSKSPSDGSRLRVAYQGISGAYSELAAETAYPNCEAVPCEQFDTTFEALERWLVDRAVLPIENSLGGSIHRNYDLLLRHKLHIVGEVKLPIRHCLLANPGVKIEDLRRVLSHPQALAQCEHTLVKFGVIREAADDTAGAAKFIACNKLKDVGAVASTAAARIYGLNILAQDIQDDSDNFTRFLMLAREPIIPRSDRPFKTSIVFSLVEGPGALFKALAVFALRQINLAKIESRPLRKNSNNNGSSKCFDYLFYLDFEASMADPDAQNAFRHLEEFATMLRVLGSYPADT